MHGAIVNGMYPMTPTALPCTPRDADCLLNAMVVHSEYLMRFHRLTARAVIYAQIRFEEALYTASLEFRNYHIAEMRKWMCGVLDYMLNLDTGRFIDT